MASSFILASILAAEFSAGWLWLGLLSVNCLYEQVGTWASVRLQVFPGWYEQVPLGG